MKIQAVSNSNSWPRAAVSGRQYGRHMSGAEKEGEVAYSDERTVIYVCSEQRRQRHVEGAVPQWTSVALTSLRMSSSYWLSHCFVFLLHG